MDGDRRVDANTPAGTRTNSHRFADDLQNPLPVSPDPAFPPASSSSKVSATAIPRPSRRRSALSLRAKGVLALLVLIGYLAAVAVFLMNERQGLVSIVQQVEANQARVALVEHVIGALSRSLIESQSILNAQGNVPFRPVSFNDLGFHLDALTRALHDVGTAFPPVGDDADKFRQAVSVLKAAPSAETLAVVRDKEQVLLGELNHVVNEFQKDTQDLSLRYRSTQQFISIFAITASLFGAVASVAVSLVFFTRLTRDIQRLQDRAATIVAGYDGEPLVNARHDEVGDLIDAVNRMQVDLRSGERQLELARQQRFHREKMAAVGTVASAIGHEVSNPIAAIAGVAQFIVDESADDPEPQGRKINQFAAQILKQTERITKIMHQLTAVTAPRSPHPELLDLNALIRSTCGFVRYDKRFRGINFEQALAHDLPAVTAVSDHITQILLNLLFNAADATDHIIVPAIRSIRVATRIADGEVLLTVADNGRGMTPDVLARAFDESFTTKPTGLGRGIGLFVCKSLIEKARGRIELASIPGSGTTVTVCLRLEPEPHA